MVVVAIVISIYLASIYAQFAPHSILKTWGDTTCLCCMQSDVTLLSENPSTRGPIAMKSREMKISKEEDEPPLGARSSLSCSLPLDNLGVVRFMELKSPIGPIAVIQGVCLCWLKHEDAVVVAQLASPLLTAASRSGLLLFYSHNAPHICRSHRWKVSIENWISEYARKLAWQSLR